MNCITYFNNDPSGLVVTVSGYTCSNVLTAATLNYGQAICMNNDYDIITCGNVDIGAVCIPASPTPTPSNTSTPVSPTPTPTNTETPVSPTPTPTYTPSPTLTPTNTLTPTETPTNTPTMTMTSTQQSPTPTPTNTETPTPTPTPPVECFCYYILNETGGSLNYTYWNCQTGETTNPLGGGQNVQVCSSQYPTGDGGITIVPCISPTTCSFNTDCTGCSF